MLSQEQSEADLSVESEGSSDGGLAQALEVGGFALRAPRRRPRLATGVFVLGVTVTVAVSLLAPRVYTSKTTILVQRNVVIPVLVNPRRPVPTDWDVPGRGTSESIFRRDNLVAVVKEAGLDTRWDVGRSPILKLKGELSRRVFGPMSEKDMMHMLVGTLEKRLSVQVDDTTIKISVVWHDPETAYRLVSCVEQNFLKDRSAAGTDPITDTITILEVEEARQREVVAAALAEVQKLQLAAAPPGRQARTSQERSSSNELTDKYEVEKELAEDAENAEKRRTIHAAEEARQRRLAELRAQLAELRITYASAHPLVLAMEEKIRQAEMVPPELVQMKQAEQAYPRRIKSFFPKKGGAHEAPSDLLAALQGAGVAGAEREDDPELVAAKVRLATAVQKYEELRDRIDTARIELQTMQAAFKYRYAIIDPAEQPGKPTTPNTLVIVVVGLAASVALAMAAAVAKDLADGRFIEPWQVRRRLPIPLLAELEGP
jgi:uncharacterized protein involved in exopolysaccharide biosynthesis